MQGVRRNDADITGLEMKRLSLYFHVASPFIYAENFKKFMLVQKERAVAVVFYYFDVSGYILKNRSFPQKSRPSVRIEFRYIKLAVGNLLSIAGI